MIVLSFLLFSLSHPLPPSLPSSFSSPLYPWLSTKILTPSHKTIHTYVIVTDWKSGNHGSKWTNHRRRSLGERFVYRVIIPVDKCYIFNFIGWLVNFDITITNVYPSKWLQTLKLNSEATYQTCSLTHPFCLGMCAVSGLNAQNWVEAKRWNTTPSLTSSTGTPSRPSTYSIAYTDRLTKLALQLSQKASRIILQLFRYSSRLSIASLSPSYFVVTMHRYANFNLCL